MGSQRVGHNWVTELNWTDNCALVLIFITILDYESKRGNFFVLLIIISQQQCLLNVSWYIDKQKVISCGIFSKLSRQGDFISNLRSFFFFFLIYISRKIPALENFLLLSHYKAIKNYNGSDLPVHSVSVKCQVAGVILLIISMSCCTGDPLRNELPYNLIP